MKILLFDIENLHKPEHIFNSGKPGRFSARPAGFCADLAYMLVFGYKWLGDDKARSIMATKKDFKNDPFTDETFLEEVHEILSSADVVVTWYGSGHDFPFVTTRLAQKGLCLDQSIRHVDLFKTASKKLRLSSNRLDNVAKFFGLEQKTPISKKVWADCWRGDYKALEEMAAYCRQDVEVLEQVYHRMIQLGTTLPHVGAHLGHSSNESCSACGSTKVHRNGTRVTLKRRYVRLRCGECGASSTGKEI